MIPRKPGELRAAILQIPNAAAWRNVAAKTSYTNKNLVISGLILDEQNQFRLIAFDESHIAARRLEVVLDASAAGGTVAGSIALGETAKSLTMKLRFVAENVSLDTLRGYLGRPPEFLAGDVRAAAGDRSRGDNRCPENMEMDRSKLKINNLRQEGLFFDRLALSVVAHDGIATIGSSEATNGLNKIGFKGTTDLPAERPRVRALVAQSSRSMASCPTCKNPYGALPAAVNRKRHDHRLCGGDPGCSFARGPSRFPADRSRMAIPARSRSAGP